MSDPLRPWMDVTVMHVRACLVSLNRAKKVRMDEASLQADQRLAAITPQLDKQWTGDEESLDIARQMVFGTIRIPNLETGLEFVSGLLQHMEQHG